MTFLILIYLKRNYKSSFAASIFLAFRCHIKTTGFNNTKRLLKITRVYEPLKTSSDKIIMNNNYVLVLYKYGDSLSLSPFLWRREEEIRQTKKSISKIKEEHYYCIPSRKRRDANNYHLPSAVFCHHCLTVKR